MATAITEETAIDPVCGMRVKVATAEHTAWHKGHTHYFCNPGCLAKFTSEPERYLRPAEAAHRPSAPTGTIFTCPMHPEVRHVGPGSCPICGMALEPAEVSLDQGANPELVDMTRRLWVGGTLAAPVVGLDMGGHLIGFHSSWIELLFATPVVLWAGWPFFVRGYQSLVRRSLNMFTLISLGTGTAWLYSVGATLTGGVVYFESAAFIVVLTLAGQVLELRAREATSGAIRGLLGLAPRSALKVGSDGRDVEVAIESIVAGDCLRVRPGEKVPVDGVVSEGHGSVDESSLTGEAMPVSKDIGAPLMGGTVNRSGSFVMRAEKVGSDTMLARIVKLVSEAQRSRAPIQRLADKVASWFVPAVVLVALIAASAWAIWGPAPAFPHALMAAVAVLIIACPCALGLATPMSIMVSAGRGAAAGVLIRNAEALQRLEQVDTLVFDKTGTLTAGRPEITDVTGRLETLRLAASLERGSEHPIARAIVAFTQERRIELPAVTDFKNEPGRGVAGTIEGKRVLLGNARFLREHGVDLGTFQRPVMLAIDGKLFGTITVDDPIKASAPAAIAGLKQAGLRLVMVTGDNRRTARRVAEQLGIAEVEAELLPQDKAEIIRRLKSEGRIVAMAGDGINDAPALASADVGIAMGSGTDVAIESASITLVKGDLMGAVRAIRLSRATMRNVRQNLFFAFVYNAVSVPLAAGVFYPLFGILLSPSVAAAAMALSSVSVIGNALRLKRLVLS